MIAVARIEEVRAKAPIFHKGAPGESMMAVVTGEVKISAPAADGREIVLAVMREGEVFGEVALLDGSDRTADATASTNCTLLVIHRRDFLPFLNAHPQVAIRLLRVVCQRLRRTTEQVEDLLFLNLPSRLAKKLLVLAGATEDRPRERTPIIRQSQREIGNLVGLSRESINKQLSRWQKDGVLTLRDGMILLDDLEALREIAAEV
ncbi:catabolite gene activator protein [Aliidongia dinghuensis]|uniref:Catabolite gene activator protein n=1 Tax=Aliidongia dinghuensis TaxID=1867774 RepID=A0A8J3E2T7_9PROT|nr:catabolite gene activator protein [Aliidongia dinghuensis]